jgi:CDP-diacylglycerol--glycerol-3-phosphate 3-phosphatidyltransferase
MNSEPTGQLSLPSRPASIWNAANALTAMRLVLVPVFAVLLMHEDGQRAEWRIAAFSAFALASITDRLDGELARRHGLVTDVGKIADPIADKALIGAALVGLSVLAELPWWVTVLVLAREIGITLLRFVIIRHGVMPASRGGKVKTFLQAIAIGLYLLPLSGAAHLVAEVMMGLAVALTLITGLDYLVRADRLRRSSERTARARARRQAARQARGG